MERLNRLYIAQSARRLHRAPAEPIVWTGALVVVRIGAGRFHVGERALQAMVAAICARKSTDQRLGLTRTGTKRRT